MIMKYFCFLLILLHIVNSFKDIEDAIYQELPEKSVSHCVKRLNETTITGCTSKEGGNNGVVLFAFNYTDLATKLNNAKDSVIIVLYSNLFINDIQILLNNSLVNGLVVIESNLTTTPFSEDYKKPNLRFSYSLTNDFNLYGKGYAFKNWPFPVALIKSNAIDVQNQILNCYNKFNENPQNSFRCSMEIMNFNSAVSNAKFCQQKDILNSYFSMMLNEFRFCFNMTGSNYIVYTKSNATERSPNSVILLMSRMDSLSMFEKSGVSVKGELTSTAVLLSVMKLLKKMPEFETGETLKKDVVFLFLDNESYDYLGSNRFFNDMNRGKIGTIDDFSTPINISHLGLLLEIGEMGFIKYPKLTFFCNQNLTEKDRNVTMKFARNLNEAAVSNGFNDSKCAANSLQLPPSSVQYFLRQRSLPSIVLADHINYFRNPFYNSFLDDKSDDGGDNSTELLSVVNTVAAFIYKEVTGKEMPNKMTEDDEASPNKIIYCFTKNLECDLLKRTMELKDLKYYSKIGFPIPAQSHFGTKNYPSSYRFSDLVMNLIVYLSGQEVNMTDCHKGRKNCYVLNSVGNSTCYLLKINHTNVGISGDLDVSNEPMWLSSGIIGKQSIRLFASRTNNGLLTAGIIITVIAFAIMTILKPNLSDLFKI